MCPKLATTSWRTAWTWTEPCYSTLGRCEVVQDLAFALCFCLSQPQMVCPWLAPASWRTAWIWTGPVSVLLGDVLYSRIWPLLCVFVCHYRRWCTHGSRLHHGELHGSGQGLCQCFWEMCCTPGFGLCCVFLSVTTADDVPMARACIMENCMDLDRACVSTLGR